MRRAVLTRIAPQYAAQKARLRTSQRGITLCTESEGTFRASSLSCDQTKVDILLGDDIRPVPVSPRVAIHVWICAEQVPERP
jgi:hypothetical protein